MKLPSKSLILYSLSWIAIAIVFFSIRPVLLPFIIAGMLAYVLDPLVTEMNRIRIGSKKLPRAIALILVYLVVITLCGLMGYFFVPKIYAEAVKLTYEALSFLQGIDNNKIQTLSQELADWLEKYHLPIGIVSENTVASSEHLISLNLNQISQDIITAVINYIKVGSANFIGEFRHIVAHILESFFQFFLVLVITIFILTDTLRIKRFIYKLVPESQHANFAQFLSRMDQGLSGVVRGQLLICLINAVLTLIGLLLLQIKFALLLATLAGLLSIIPIFGSIISTVPIVLIALTNSLATGFLALAWIVGIHALEANLLNPKILGNSARIHPTLITLSLATGKYFFGVVGLILAVPTASILLNVFNFVLEKATSSQKGVIKS